MATLTVARSLPLGRRAVCVFLIDAWCAGVEDAFFHVADGEEYEDFCENSDETANTAPIDPARALKFLRDVAAFGATNGFSPPDDLPEMERIFGDIEPAGATFALGDRGVPHYVVGPDEPPAQAQQAREKLERTLGPNGFRFTEAYDYVDDNGEIIQAEAVEKLEPPPA
jgi:hypothetical protein